MRIPLTLLPALAGLALIAASKPEQRIAIRFHVEAQLDPGKKFTIPVDLVTRPGRTGMAKLATATERDIAEILSVFTARDGSSGIAFQLDPHGRNKLQLDSAQNIGKYLFVFFNGRHLTELLIDRPVSDGILVIPRGLTAEDVTAIKDYLFPRTEKEKREAQRLKHTPDAALPPPPRGSPRRARGDRPRRGHPADATTRTLTPRETRRPTAVTRARLTSHPAMPRSSHTSPCPATIALVVALLSHARALELALPTPNDAILRDDGPAYYQFVERTFQGRRSRPWQGGQYGYVRDPAILSIGTIYTKLHEGIDVRPVHRDPRGEPLDPIRAIDDGTVVHTSPNPRDSNYGRYAVIRHDWDGCPYFSLYAHLASIDVRPDDRVKRGARIALLGYSGAGIDRERAHLHLEVNLLLQSRFERWHGALFPTQPNRHGIYNGLNMVGIDPARLLLQSRRKPDLRVPDILRDEPVAFRVRVPHTRNFELVSRYPWLNQDPAPGHPVSWELSFNRAGVPLRARPSDIPTDAPAVVEVRPANTAHPALTHHLITGTGTGRRLTASGQRLFQLLLMP